MQMTNPWSVFQYWQPAYSVINAGIGLRTDDESYSLSLWVKNIADTRWIKSWSPGSPTNAATIQLLDFPRSFGGTLRVTLK
jgi:iron complex outermembrane receptor protein